MKKMLPLFLLLAGITSFSQDAAHNWTVQLFASVDDDPASITLKWLPNAAVGETYYIWKKEKETVGWGTSIGSVSAGATLEFTDDDVVIGKSYEYMVQLRSGGSVLAWSYINSGIEVPLNPNKGDMLLLVDQTHATALSSEITQLEQDLYADGWMVTTLEVDPEMAPIDLKDEIKSQYIGLNDLKAIYLLGDLPVPYSGDLYPDYYYNHKGAWPADVYYADMFGEWTDETVNVTVATDPRNHNIPGDNKFDQSKVPSTVNLQISRVDFSNLSSFAETEEELLREYLNKAHEFKIAEYVPTERGLIDQSSLAYSLEGFAQNGIRNFTAFFGADSVKELDYWTTLTTEDYLWSYGCGDGTYTLANGLFGASALSTSHMADGDNLSTFTMLYGSYYGDWDTPNNLMRASLASGKTLSCSWAGRPNWHYQHMALGENLGYAARISQDVFSDYFSLTLGDGSFVTYEGVHVAQLGDPSLRMYYVQPPADLEVESNAEVAELAWTASADPDVEGYNIYRRMENSLWTKVNTDIVNSSNFTDETVSEAGDYIYMVKAVKLKTNASGSFYNESLGIEGETSFYLVINQENAVDVSIYPNPTTGEFKITSNRPMELITVTSLNGTIVYQENLQNKSANIHLNHLSKGAYILELKGDGYAKKERILIQ